MPQSEKKRKQVAKLRGSEGTVIETTHYHLDAKSEKSANYQGFFCDGPLRALQQNLNEVQDWPRNKDEALPNEEYRTEQRAGMIKEINKHLKQAVQIQLCHGLLSTPCHGISSDCRAKSAQECVTSDSTPDH